MKYAVISVIILAIAAIGFFIIRKRTATVEVSSQDYSAEIMACLGCEYEIIKNAKSVSDVIKKYKELLLIGKKEGFTPLIIIPSRMTYEIVNRDAAQDGADDSPEAITEKAKSINATAFLQKRTAEDLEEYKDADIMGEFSKMDATNSFESLIDFTTNKPHSTIIIARIPTNKPWELAAWVPMGGFNECPYPEEQVAVFQYWHEKYGAMPALVTGDIWELYVERPVRTKEAAMSLALEQFGFCSDIVAQGTEAVNHLAGTLVDATVWFFWWD